MALAALVLGPARADLVVLARGDVLKVTSFEVVDQESIVLRLDSGGAIELPLLWVERIVDDEWAEPADEDPELEAGLVLRFEDGMEAPDVPFRDIIFEIAQRFQVNPRLVGAMMEAESAFQAEAVSVKGARGLMQLMPATAERFGVPSEKLFEPALNIEAGVRYLDWLIDRFDGSLPLVLSAYNAGEGTVQKYGGVPPFRETQGYIRRIYGRLGLSVDEVLGQ